MIHRSGLCRKPVGCKPPSRRSAFIHSLLPSNWKTPSSRSSSPLNTEPNGSFDLVSRANDAAMTCAARHPNPLKQMDANEVGRGLGCGNCANCRNRGFAVFESLEKSRYGQLARYRSLPKRSRLQTAQHLTFLTADKFLPHMRFNVFASKDTLSVLDDPLEAVISARRYNRSNMDTTR